MSFGSHIHPADHDDDEQLFSVLLLSRLKGIFAYPAGMNIKTLDLDGFHLEVWTNRSAGLVIVLGNHK